MPRLDHLLPSLTGWLLLCAATPGLAADCSGPTRQQVAAPDAVVAAVRARGLQVLTFVGYSGAGYQDDAAMQALAARVLDAADPARVLVNAGGTAEGIGAVKARRLPLGWRVAGSSWPSQRGRQAGPTQSRRAANMRWCCQSPSRKSVRMCRSGCLSCRCCWPSCRSSKP